MKIKWKPIKGKFNKNGKHEGVYVIVWNSKLNHSEIDAYYSSSPSNKFWNGTYTHFMIAPKKPKEKFDIRKMTRYVL